MDAPLTERDLLKTIMNIVSHRGPNTFSCLELDLAAADSFIQIKKMSGYISDGAYLWLCALVSRALRGGVGDPCSVTLRTSILLLSGRWRTLRESMGESTRFRGGSYKKKGQDNFLFVNFSFFQYCGIIQGLKTSTNLGRFWEADPRPHSWGIAPSCLGEDSRSSSPGSPCRKM